MPDVREKISPNTKASRLNRDQDKYGTIAEIGAGQEVAGWFFRVGGAAGTIAKTMSAYDMTFSDAIYGGSDRYVSRTRLKSMLEHEYMLLVERLGEERGGQSCFFAFANTVAATSYTVKGEGQGWMGIRFQTHPRRHSNDLLVHVRLLDWDNLQQQEAIGILGVNLIYAAFHHTGAGQEDEFLESLIDGINPERVEVDVILPEGPDLRHFEERLLNLRLVSRGMTDAVVFDPWGNVRHGSEIFYKKALLVQRGSFRPVTRVNLEMMDAALERFESELKEEPAEDSPILEVMEISMTNLLRSGDVDPEDFLARVDLLKAMGKMVMVSNYAEFYKLSSHLGQYTDKRIRLVLGVTLMEEVFKEKYYESLGGGILESFGRLFRNDLRFYVYPALDPDSGGELHVEDLPIEGTAAHLHRYLVEEGAIVGLKNIQEASAPYSSQEVSQRIADGDASWEKMVMPEVAREIKAHGYFGWSG